jgi:site-specific DNA-cytosine methylase
MTRPFAIDVCAGAGGLSLGLRRAGFDVLGVEHDPDAVATHRAMVGPCDEADVTTWRPPHEAEVTGGGVPCQGWSVAGKGGGFDEARGHLFKALLRIAVEARSRVCLLENVRGMLSAGAVPVICQAFRAAGFEPVYALLNAADYGVGQNRVRLFVAGFRDPGDLARWRWPAPSHGAPGNLFGLPAWVTVRQALGLGGGAYATGRPGRNSQGMRYVAVDAPAPTCGATRNANLLSPLDAPSNTVTAREWKDGARGSRGGKARGRGAGYALSAALARVLDAPSPTVTGREPRSSLNPGANGATGNRRKAGDRLNPALAALDAAGLLDRPATTIPGDPRVAAAGHHDRQQRGAVRLTLAQCAALQSFPADFVFTGNKGAGHRQCGNAVPVLLAEALGGALLRALAAGAQGRA